MNWRRKGISLFFLAALGSIVISECGILQIDPTEFDALQFAKTVPDGFLLGTATSAHQIEGGNNNDWTQWETESYPDGRPHIADGSVSGSAADSWNRWSEDIALLEELGVSAYRFSIEWSRLEPQQDVWDATAESQYRTILQALQGAGITPMVTLYHFTLPIWFADKGGWESSTALADFEDYVSHAAASFGDLVDLWCTVNEPNVLSMQSYIEGNWPPGLTDTARATEVYATLIEAHAVAARALRTADTVDADGDGSATRIGLAFDARVLTPASTSQLDNIIAAISDAYWNDAIPEAVRTGWIRLSVPGIISIDRHVPDLADSCDYLGINYYTRDLIRADIFDPALSQQISRPGASYNDLGWEIYPEGLELVLKRFGSYGWPIYITENGTADRSGSFRSDFLRSHLLAVERALNAGVDVLGYFHWSLIDNFEWDEGYAGKFGLYAVDFEDTATFKRTPRPAVNVFQEVASALGLLP